MTLGYPDWQDYAQWTGGATVIGSQPVSNTTPYSQNFQLGNFASLFLFCNAPGFGTNVSISYFTDSTKTKGLGGYSWTVQQTTVLEVVVPNLGPYCTVTISMTQVGSQNIGVEVIPLNAPVARCMYPRQNNRFYRSGSVPISTTQQFSMPQTMEGTMYISVMPPDATAKVTYTVSECAIDGTLTDTIATAVLPAAPVYFVTAANNQPIAITITNTDATAAHNAVMRVMVLPAA